MSRFQKRSKDGAGSALFSNYYERNFEVNRSQCHISESKN